MATARPACKIGEITYSCRGGGCRASAVVDGQPLWFDSSDADLVPSPEAFGSAMLIPALHANRPLAIDQGVCAMWMGHLRQVIDVVSRWWDYPRLD